MCMKCQKVYCKKCIDEWKDKEKDDKCPNKCENPNYQKSLEKNNILCKLKFKCEKCENEFLYEELIKHIANCSGQVEKGENINNGINENISTRRLRKISKNEAEKLKIKSTKITSKLNIFYNYFIINCAWISKCWEIKLNIYVRIIYLFKNIIDFKKKKQ